MKKYAGNHSGPHSRARGFVIATDAFFSLIILFAIITVAFDALKLNGRELADRESLSTFAEYAGRSLEQSGILARAVILDSTTEIRAFLNGWPASRCGTIAVYSSPSAAEAALLVTRPGCTFVSGVSESVQRGFIVPVPPDANFYVATVTVWVNQE